jgi:hypothetical protein
MNVSVMLGALLAIAAAGTPCAAADNPWTTPLVQEAMTKGYKSSVPPNVALVLGLSADAQAVETRQLVSRAARNVRTFNVSTGNPRRVVLFVVDEQARKTVAYLLGASGKLRKAVSYDFGAEPHELPQAQARAGLAREVSFWSKHAPGATPPTPGGVPPTG